MADSATLVGVSAFSGLAGALLTQIITAVNGFFTDKRKQAADISTQYRQRKVEIGESFYYMSGEKLACIKKNLGYWKNYNAFRSPASLNFLNTETRKFNENLERLNADNWKYNLIGLYFNVNYTTAAAVKENERSHQLFLAYLDVVEQLRSDGDKGDVTLYQRYAETLVNMCTHYDEVATRLEHDMAAVKIQLLAEFAS